MFDMNSLTFDGMASLIWLSSWFMMKMLPPTNLRVGAHLDLIQFDLF